MIRDPKLGRDPLDEKLWYGYTVTADDNLCGRRNIIYVFIRGGYNNIIILLSCCCVNFRVLPNRM